MKKYTDLQGLAVGQVWEHKNGNIYEIYDFTNLEEGRQDEYPTSVSYRNIHTGAPYSRAVSRWAGSFTRRQELEAGEQRPFQVKIAYFDERGVQRLFEGEVEATTQKQALAWGREQVFASEPKPQFIWVNCTGGVAAELKLVRDNG